MGYKCTLCWPPKGEGGLPLHKALGDPKMERQVKHVSIAERDKLT